MAEKQRKWALVIGIDEYPFFPKENQLAGCVNDAKMMALLLRERFQFRSENIRMLLNGGAKRATILDALDEMAIKILSGDLVLVFFSGHGARLYEETLGDEPDRWDETLVPYDSGRGQHPPCDITDDELRRRLLPIIKRAEQVIIWVDACRSASVLRDEEDQHSVRWVAPVKLERREFVSGLEFDLDPSRYVLLTACADTEGAYELTPEETGSKVHGVFSWHLARVLSRTQPGATWRDVYEQLRGAVQISQPLQTPQIEGALDREIFHRGWDVPEAFTPVLGMTEEGEVRLGSGWLHGVTVGMVLGIHPPASLHPQVKNRLARVRVDKGGATEARASFLAEAVPLPSACRAFLESLGGGRHQISVALGNSSQDTDEILRRIHSSPWLCVASEREQAWVRIERLDTRLLRSGGFSGLDLPSSGWLMLDRVGAPLGVSGCEPGRVVSNLEAWARYRYLLSLENLQPSSLDGQLELILLRQDKNGEWQEASVGDGMPSDGIPCLADGDRLGLTILNHTGFDLYIGVLDLGVSGAISLLYPPPGGKELMAAGGRLDIGQGLRGKIRLRLPSREKNPLKSMGGIETIKLFASLTPLDLSIWIQNPFRESPRVESLKTGEEWPDSDSRQRIWTTCSRSFRLLPRR